MDWLSRIKESPNYDRLIHSVEFRAIRRDALIVWIATAALLLLSGAGLSGGRAKTMASFVVTVLLMVPYSLYFVYRLVILFVHIQRWTFTEAVLDKPHMGNKGSAYFTVTVRDRSGRELQRDTANIFGRSFDPVFEECVNQKALIGYNDKTDTIVVIKILQ